VKIQTRKFGEIEIDDQKTLFMPEGLPGFPGFDRFVLIEDPKSAPFCWFQSVTEPNLALVVMSPFLFKPDYEIDLEGFIATRNWKGIKTADLLIYVVINISEADKKRTISANLIGPIVINPKTNEAIQVIVPNSPYSHQHNVLESA